MKKFSFFLLALTGLLFSCKPETDRLPQGPDAFVGWYDVFLNYEYVWSDYRDPYVYEGEYCYLRFKKLSEDSIGEFYQLNQFFYNGKVSGRSVTFPQVETENFGGRHNSKIILTFQTGYLDNDDGFAIPFTATGTCETTDVYGGKYTATLEGSGSFTFVRSELEE